MANGYITSVNNLVDALSDNFTDGPIKNETTWVSLTVLNSLFNDVVFKTREYVLEQNNTYLGTSTFSGNILGTVTFEGSVIAPTFREGGIALSTKYVLKTTYDTKIAEIESRLDALENP